MTHTTVNHPHNPYIEDLMDEVMEEYWIAGEEKRPVNLSLDFIADLTSEKKSQVIDKLSVDGFAKDNAGNLELTEKGKLRSKLIVRRHRLAERLLKEILDIRNNEEMDAQACLMEHILTERVTESICKFLGHPRQCPHGKKIPEGTCCTEMDMQLKPFIRRLCDVEIGERGTVSFIASANNDRVSQLASLGLHPDAEIKLQQKKPAYIVKIDETTLSIDKDITKEIYVKM
jgi:DtxR family transcriptional regulator, Mn-dependent transcriptional regulator